MLSWSRIRAGTTLCICTRARTRGRRRFFAFPRFRPRIPVGGFRGFRLLIRGVKAGHGILWPIAFTDLVDGGADFLQDRFSCKP